MCQTEGEYANKKWQVYLRSRTRTGICDLCNKKMRVDDKAEFYFGNWVHSLCREVHIKSGESVPWLWSYHSGEK